MTHCIFPSKQLSHFTELIFTGLICNNLFFLLLLPKFIPLVVLLNVNFFNATVGSVTQKLIAVWRIATGNVIPCSFLIWASSKLLLKEIHSLQRVGFSEFSLRLGQAFMPQFSLLLCGPALTGWAIPDRHYLGWSLSERALRWLWDSKTK